MVFHSAYCLVCCYTIATISPSIIFISFGSISSTFPHFILPYRSKSISANLSLSPFLHPHPPHGALLQLGIVRVLGLGITEHVCPPSPTVSRRAIISYFPSPPPPSSALSALSTLSGDTSPYYNCSQYRL